MPLHLVLKDFLHYIFYMKLLILIAVSLINTDMTVFILSYTVVQYKLTRECWDLQQILFSPFW